MFLLQILGYIFLCFASISSSVSMNFQKMASNQTNYNDPRTKLKKRKRPLTSSLYCRPLFIIALFLSGAASTLDFLALTWLPPATVGVFGSVSIIINLAVTRIILFETPKQKEWVPIAFIIVGCMMSISVTPEDDSNLITPQLIERPISCVYIVFNWVFFILCSILLEYATLPNWIEKIGFPFIGGALGAQNVCMGKYIAYAFATIKNQQLSVRSDVLAATILMCFSSIIIHVHWLNKGLQKYNAYYCIIVYQTAWFMFTTLSGIIVYDNISQLNVYEKCIFTTGVLSAAFGVRKISILHQTTQTEDSSGSYSAHNLP
jgi:hypothetical protein